MAGVSKLWATAAVPVLLLGLATGGCTVTALDEYCPPPDLGRPGWVRASAGFGGWIGGGLGAVGSLALLPITYPVSLLAEEPLGYSRDEFRYMPITMCASAGHYLFGAPPDLFHFIFYRAWVEQDETPGYGFTPMSKRKLPDTPEMGEPKEEPAKQPDKPPASKPAKKS